MDTKKFSDILLKIYQNEYDGIIYDGGRNLCNILMERKTAARINNVHYKPQEIHQKQITAYATLYDGQLDWVWFTYVDKPSGKAVNLIIPVIYTGTELYENVPKDVRSKSIVIDRVKFRLELEKKANLLAGHMSAGTFCDRMPSFKVECNWCVYKSACHGSVRTEILDWDIIRPKIENWKNALQFSERVLDPESSNISRILKEWGSDVVPEC